MSKVQILVVNKSQELPTKSGGVFKVQDAETVILNDDGSPQVVGPLSVPRDLIDKVVPGLYDATFVWVRDYKSKRLVHELQSLTALTAPARPAAPAAPARV